MIHTKLNMFLTAYRKISKLVCNNKQFPHHTQTSSNSLTIEADSSNWYVHISLFDRTYWMFRRN